jgi:glutathione S-transferase
MMLIGMFDSPFARRVAVTLKLLGLPFAHRNWSVGSDFDRIRAFNPLGRVPTLVQPDGETLIDSAAILDFLDEYVGEERALLPRSGRERREALRAMAIATGAAEKGVLQIYEKVFRPEEKRHAAWVDRCRAQTHGALGELEELSKKRSGSWLIGDRMTQADVTVTCVFTFMGGAFAGDRLENSYPALSALSQRCEALPAFGSTRAVFHPPSG